MTKDETLDDLDKQIAETKAALADVHGTECEVYARIVGYYCSVKTGTKAKKRSTEYAHSLTSRARSA